MDQIKKVKFNIWTWKMENSCRWLAKRAWQGLEPIQDFKVVQLLARNHPKPKIIKNPKIIIFRLFYVTMKSEESVASSF